jgi:hypothetical protein
MRRKVSKDKSQNSMFISRKFEGFKRKLFMDYIELKF